MKHSTRILLIAEPLRRSNATRLATLGSALHEAGYAITLAMDPDCKDIIGDVPFRTMPLHPALTREERKGRWRAMLPLYDMETLERYIREDIRMVKTVAPHLVIGDMRPSLPISARMMDVRYAVIVDAASSSESQLPFELPNMPFLDEIGRGPAQGLFDMLVHMGMFVHALPGNLTRLNHGVPGWHSDVRQSYTDADLVIYPNIPETVPMKELPPTHRFIGPIRRPDFTASPEPSWWNTLPSDKPIVWVNLSSSDSEGHASAILDGLAVTECTTVICSHPDNPVLQGRNALYVTDITRSSEMEQRAQLVITNADTTAIQQSLAAGKPVVVVPEPEESLSYANAIRAMGAAEVIHGIENVDATLHLVVTRILADPDYVRSAEAIAKLIAQYDSGKAIVEFVDQVLAVTEGGAAA